MCAASPGQLWCAPLLVVGLSACGGGGEITVDPVRLTWGEVDFMEEMPAEVAAQALKGLPAGIVQQFKALPPTQGFESAASFPNVTAALLTHGYPAADVRAIMGGNWLRLYEQVWAA